MKARIICGLVVGLLAVPFGLAIAANHDGGPTAHAEILDAQGTRIGEARFRQGPNGTLINLELRGLPPGPKGIHIHSVGTCDDHQHGFQ
ncbi:MAG: superoxide dismutase family protein, partial [Aquisalimonadaceae bacterium]